MADIKTKNTAKYEGSSAFVFIANEIWFIVKKSIISISEVFKLRCKAIHIALLIGLSINGLLFKPQPLVASEGDAFHRPPADLAFVCFLTYGQTRYLGFRHISSYLFFPEITF